VLVGIVLNGFHLSEALLPLRTVGYSPFWSVVTGVVLLLGGLFVLSGRSADTRRTGLKADTRRTSRVSTGVSPSVQFRLPMVAREFGRWLGVLSSLLPRPVASWTVVPIVALALPASAQTVDRPFADLGPYLRAGRTVTVTGTDNREVTGVVVRLSPTDLVLQPEGGGELALQASEIGWIERHGDPVWDGALVAAGGLGLSFMGGAGASCSPDCAAVVSGALAGGAAIGFVVGALVDLAHSGRWLEYGTRPRAARRQVRAPRPVEAVGDLWSRVLPGDTVRVRGFRGAETTGIFERTSATALTLVIDGQLTEIPAADVRRVQRRTGRVGLGMVVGPMVGATWGALAPNPSANRSGNVIAGAFGGFAIGTVVGMAVSGWATVYGASEPEVVRIYPLLGNGNNGLAVSMSF